MLWVCLETIFSVLNLGCLRRLEYGLYMVLVHCKMCNTHCNNVCTMYIVVVQCIIQHYQYKSIDCITHSCTHLNRDFTANENDYKNYE